MKLKKLLPLLLPCAASLTGCASIVNGTHQKVEISTPPARGAYCNLSNSKGSWVLKSTPGTVKVHRAFDALNIKCHKKGFNDADKIVNSHTKAMAFGNLVFGGIIGAGVDTGDGAAYNYPEFINVPMYKASHKKNRLHKPTKTIISKKPTKQVSKKKT